MDTKIFKKAIAACALTLCAGYASAATYVLQAENASGDVVFENIHGGYTGTGYVNTPNMNGVNLLFFKHSTSETALPATVKIRYANGASTARPANIYVNNDSFTNQFAPTGGWNVWKEVTVSSWLLWTSNEFLVEATTSQGLANIDKITVVTP
jgi:hypothetical protein